MAVFSPRGRGRHMGLEARQSARLASHSFTLRGSRRALGTSHCSFLIYGTGIRNAINPSICNTNSVLIYGNRTPKYYVPSPAPAVAARGRRKAKKTEKEFHMVTVPGRHSRLGSLRLRDSNPLFIPQYQQLSPHPPRRTPETAHPERPRTLGTQNAPPASGGTGIRAAGLRFRSWGKEIR